MSLSQATSPEEAKRELKQQVFLAIQGKYDTRQTSQLIEDIDTITSAIAGSLGVPQSSLGKSDKPTSAAEISKAIMDQPYNDAKVDAKPVIAGEYKPFLLVDDQMRSQLKNVVVDKNGMPERNVVKMEVTYEGLGVSACQSVDYYRHSITVISGGWSFKRWFYCDEQNISSWSETRLLGMLDYVNKFFADNMGDSMNAAN